MIELVDRETKNCCWFAAALKAVAEQKKKPQIPSYANPLLDGSSMKAV